MAYKYYFFDDYEFWEKYQTYLAYLCQNKIKCVKIKKEKLWQIPAQYLVSPSFLEKNHEVFGLG